MTNDFDSGRRPWWHDKQIRAGIILVAAVALLMMMCIVLGILD